MAYDPVFNLLLVYSFPEPLARERISFSWGLFLFFFSVPIGIGFSTTQSIVSFKSF